MLKTIGTTALIMIVFVLSGCGGGKTALTDAQAAAIAEICAVDAMEFTDISRDVLTKERMEKFPAVTNVLNCGNYYAFIVKPIAYNGPVTIAAVIDSERGESVGMRIVEHTETPHYVRDMQSSWFTERFAGKYAGKYLHLARLNAADSSGIVAVTGATVTTEGIINGVNAAFGVYTEYVLGTAAEAVPYMVRFEPGEGDGPSETESLMIRAQGVILAEVPLEDIRTLPQVKRTMSIHSSSGVTRHSFRGTRLLDILDSVDPSFAEDYAMVLAVGVDDYISGIGMDEIKAENNVYVMYEDNGEPLPKKNGEPGALRVIVLDDVFGQRFTNYLLEIVLEEDLT